MATEKLTWARLIYDHNIGCRYVTQHHKAACMPGHQLLYGLNGRSYEGLCKSFQQSTDDIITAINKLSSTTHTQKHAGEHLLHTAILQWEWDNLLN